MQNIHLEPLGGGIEIYVSKSYRFSTDTILLADFSKQNGCKKCVDLGTGCGTIPLLWHKHNKSLLISAVEIQPEACALFEKSLEHNCISGKINVINADLRQSIPQLANGSFDLVCCNPPYKISGSGIKNPENARLVARHEEQCTLDDVCACASKLLQFGGRLCLCQRPERLSDALEAMRNHKIEPKRLRLVQQRWGKAPKLFLLEGRRGGKRGYLDVMPTLFIEDEAGKFSREMLEIYGSYKEGHEL